MKLAIKGPALKGYLIFLILLPGITGCTFSDVQVEDVEKVTLTRLQGGKVGMKVYIPIYNPNKLQFKVSDIDLDIRVNSILVGRITEYGQVEIKKNSREVYAFPVDLELSGLLKGAMALLSLAGKDNVRMDLQGTLEIRYFLGKKVLDIHSASDVDID